MNAFCVVGLGFGDEGKGSIVDHLTRKHNAKTIVRFNGAHQAAHNVVLPDGRHHTFSQFGSGMFADPEVETYLGPHMMWEPPSLYAEAHFLGKKDVPAPLRRVVVHPDAVMITPFHRALNRAREAARGAGRHGSCGLGVGEAAKAVFEKRENRVLRAKAITKDWHIDLNPTLDEIAYYTKEEFDALDLNAAARERLGADILPFTEPRAVTDKYIAYIRQLQSAGLRIEDETYLRERAKLAPVVFEGAQGVLLDEWVGFHPHTTWSTTTADYAWELWSDVNGRCGLGSGLDIIGVTRCYQTRHGAGPMPSEYPLAGVLTKEHNGVGEWQGSFRVGHLDFMLLRYALRMQPVDALAVTCLDELNPSLMVCDTYDNYDHGDGGESIEEFANTQSARNSPTYFEKLERRTKELFLATPNLLSCPYGTDDFLRYLEYNLEEKVRIASFGPTHLDKKERREILTWK